MTSASDDAGPPEDVVGPDVGADVDGADVAPVVVVDVVAPPEVVGAVVDGVVGTAADGEFVAPPSPEHAEAIKHSTLMVHRPTARPTMRWRIVPLQYRNVRSVVPPWYPATQADGGANSARSGEYSVETTTVVISPYRPQDGQDDHHPNRTDERAVLHLRECGVGFGGSRHRERQLIDRPDEHVRALRAARYSLI